MMKPQPLELHSAKDRFGRRSFHYSLAEMPLPLSETDLKGAHSYSFITGSPPINDDLWTFGRRQASGFLVLINGSEQGQKILVAYTLPAENRR